MKANLGQARAVRAYCYTILAQLYQFTYNEANKDKPCVPIVKDNMPAEQQTNNPRASVQAVYDFIMADLNYAISALEGWARSSKGAADQAVAYGLRARVNLLLGNYAEAAEDAVSSNYSPCGAVQMSGEASGTYC